MFLPFGLLLAVAIDQMVVSGFVVAPLHHAGLRAAATAPREEEEEELMSELRAEVASLKSQVEQLTASHESEKARWKVEMNFMHSRLFNNGIVDPRELVEFAAIRTFPDKSPQEATTSAEIKFIISYFLTVASCVRN